MVYFFLLVILPLTYLVCPVMVIGILVSDEQKTAPPLRNFIFFGGLAWMEMVALFIRANDSPGGNAGGWLMLVSLATGLTLAGGLLFNCWFRFIPEYRSLAASFHTRRRETIEAAVQRHAARFPEVKAAEALQLAVAMARNDQGPGVSFPRSPEFFVCVNPGVFASLRQEMERALEAVEGEERRTGETVLVSLESLAALARISSPPQEGMFDIPLGQYLRHPGSHVWSIIGPFYQNDRPALGVGQKIREAYERNRMEVSASQLNNTALRQGGVMEPWAYEGADAFHRYLRDTPFDVLHKITARLGIPSDIRPEHGVIVGKTGAGKSQLLEKLILADLRQADPPGMIIIDSKADKGSLFNRIPRLDVFHPDHGRLRDRLIIVDPVNDKPALNMFSFSGELTHEKVNQINAGMRYFFGGLLGDELSGQMNTLFLPLLHVILRIPGATLHDLQKLVRDPLQYPDILEQIPRGIKRFLLEEFTSKNEGYRATKQSLVTRIQGIINEVTLDDMFSAPTNAFDVAEALGEGKVILVSTNVQALQHLSPIFGKYWIAQTLNAGMSRKGERPIHFYCDEAAPYVDDKLQTMLTTLRSYNLGVMLAFQGVWQMGAYARAILGQTNIKFISGADEADAEAFAPFYRGMKAEEIHAVQKSGAIAAFAMQHSKLERAVVVRFPFGELDGEPHMSDADYQRLRRLNAETLRSRPQTKNPLNEAMDTLAAQLAKPRPAEPLVNLHYPDLPWKLEKDPPDTNPPEDTSSPEPPAPARKPPTDKIVVAPKPAVRDSAKPPKRRRKPDAPDTSGSKPTGKW